VKLLDYIPFISAGAGMKAPLVVRLIEAVIVGFGAWFGTYQSVQNEIKTVARTSDMRMNAMEEKIDRIASDVSSMRSDLYVPAHRRQR